MDARLAVEAAARASYGRLVAYLASRSRDLAAAEDALADSFRAALETWPRDGVPRKPEAWLLVAARRRLTDLSRHDQVRAAASPTLAILAEEVEAGEAPAASFPDERLALLFVCAHPAIDPAARTPLMLQTVLGLDAARIASAFLVAPAAMGQRLTRAKGKIRDAGIAFEVPDTSELAPRLEAVLAAIYAAYGAGWDDLAGADPRRRGLAEEAVFLARVVVQLLPAEPEAKGLLALMLHCEARRQARRDVAGAFVPLSEQDTGLWSRRLMDEAEGLLAAAAPARRLGRFQLEAAIQSAHAERARSGGVDWPAIVALYDGLMLVAPSIGALVGRAAAVGESSGPAAGLALLHGVPAAAVAQYQPFWALNAHLLSRLGRRAEATAAYDSAIGLATDPQVRAFLIERAAAAGASEA
ncbi:MAG: sigma-70 region 2 family protein [Rhodospirillales bacterium]|nr:sigma-70 region 2 family protein [Rhodospirillales bacterium]